MTRPERLARLQDAKLLLIFTPELCPPGEALAALDAAAAHVDIVQVRPKPKGDRAPGAAQADTVTAARAAYEWCERVLDLVSRMPPAERPLVMVNDRVDVAAALAPRGLDGVHVGTDDLPPRAARLALGDELILGRSSHGAAQIAAAFDQPVDLLGFGPVFPTATKGYLAGGPVSTPAIVGPEAAWVAAQSAPVPVFPIGGIDLTNIDQLTRAGRAAVGSAILGAEDPAAAAKGLRAALKDA